MVDLHAALEKGRAERAARQKEAREFADAYAAEGLYDDTYNAVLRLIEDRDDARREAELAWRQVAK